MRKGIVETMPTRYIGVAKNVHPRCFNCVLPAGRRPLYGKPKFYPKNMVLALPRFREAEPCRRFLHLVQMATSDWPGKDTRCYAPPLGTTQRNLSWRNLAILPCIFPHPSRFASGTTNKCIAQNKRGALETNENDTVGVEFKKPRRGKRGHPVN